MKKNWLVIVLLVAVLFSRDAIAGEYAVRPGDTFSGIAKKNGMTVVSLKSINSQIKNINKIFPGQSINLSEKGRYVGVRSVQNTQKSQVFSRVVRSNENRVWEKVGEDPYKGTAQWAVEHFNLPDEVRKAVLKNIATNNFTWDTLEGGKTISAITFGKNKIARNVLTGWNATRNYAIKNYGVGEYDVFKVLWCGNWGYRKKIIPEVVINPPEPEEDFLTTIETPTQSEVPSIFVREEIQKIRTVRGIEGGAGIGAWKNFEDSVEGLWWYLEFKYKDIKHCQKQLANGTLTPFIGGFGRGNEGKSDVGYKWDAYGFGPEIGVKWDGYTELDYPQSLEFTLRAIREFSDGSNDSIGYAKSEEHDLIGTNVSYTREFGHHRLGYTLYSEGWWDISRKIESTWSGDHAPDATSVNFGAMVYRDLGKNFVGRAGAQIEFQPENNRLGANIRAELEYDDWLIVGPTFGWSLDSDIAEEIGATTFGCFARLEFDKEFQEAYTVSYMKEVSASDKPLLNY